MSAMIAKAATHSRHILHVLRGMLVTRSITLPETFVMLSRKRSTADGPLLSYECGRNGDSPLSRGYGAGRLGGGAKLGTSEGLLPFMASLAWLKSSRPETSRLDCAAVAVCCGIIGGGTGAGSGSGAGICVGAGEGGGSGIGSCETVEKVACLGAKASCATTGGASGIGSDGGGGG